MKISLGKRTKMVTYATYVNNPIDYDVYADQFDEGGSNTKSTAGGRDAAGNLPKSGISVEVSMAPSTST